MTRKLNRRQFTKLAASIPLVSNMSDCEQLKYAGGLTEILGIRVGHYTLRQRPTGCTVVLCEEGAVAGVDVRGSAPGTRETDLLNPINSVQKIHAVLLSGGSAFGLSASTGVVQYLEERGVGYRTTHLPVPIVPAAILYDLGLGDPTIRPDSQSGYEACQAASSGQVQEGCVGAGAGATVGKLFGMDRAMKSGVGSASLRVEDLLVAALAAVNSVGDVIDPHTGRVLAGARTEDGRKPVNTMQVLRQRPRAAQGQRGENTTLVVVATNANLEKTGMTKVAQMSHDGLARAINPVHMPSDGDTVFALSTGKIESIDLGTVGALAAEVTAQAIVRAVLSAKGSSSLPAACDLKT
jgi:L-aminopeptidase/D-esterase-like protein